MRGAVAKDAGEVFARVEVLQEGADGFEGFLGELDAAGLG